MRFPLPLFHSFSLSFSLFCFSFFVLNFLFLSFCLLIFFLPSFLPSFHAFPSLIPPLFISLRNERKKERLLSFVHSLISVFPSMHFLHFLLPFRSSEFFLFF